MTAKLNMANVTASVIIPWKNRPELEVTLRHNVPLFSAAGFGVIIVNCGGRESELAGILRDTKCDADVVEVQTTRFNRSLSLNMGAHCSTSDVLLLLDADLMLDENTLPECVAGLDAASVVTFEMLREARPPCQEINFSPTGLKDIVISHRMELTWGDGTVTSVPNYTI